MTHTTMWTLQWVYIPEVQLTDEQYQKAQEWERTLQLAREETEKKQRQQQFDQALQQHLQTLQQQEKTPEATEATPQAVPEVTETAPEATEAAPEEAVPEAVVTETAPEASETAAEATKTALEATETTPEAPVKKLPKKFPQKPSKRLPKNISEQKCKEQQALKELQWHARIEHVRGEVYRKGGKHVVLVGAAPEPMREVVDTEPVKQKSKNNKKKKKKKSDPQRKQQEQEEEEEEWYKPSTIYVGETLHTRIYFLHNILLHMWYTICTGLFLQMDQLKRNNSERLYMMTRLKYFQQMFNILLFNNVTYLNIKHSSDIPSLQKVHNIKITSSQDYQQNVMATVAVLIEEGVATLQLDPKTQSDERIWYLIHIFTSRSLMHILTNYDAAIQNLQELAPNDMEEQMNLILSQVPSSQAESTKQFLVDSRIQDKRALYFKQYLSLFGITPRPAPLD